LFRVVIVWGGALIKHDDLTSNRWAEEAKP